MPQDHDIDALLLAWWAWAHTETGKPRGLTNYSDDEKPQITDGEAEAVERAYLKLKRYSPADAQTLREYLSCGGNFAETSRLTGVSIPTVRLLVERAEAWIAAWLAAQEEQHD